MSRSRSRRVLATTHTCAKQPKMGAFLAGAKFFWISQHGEVGLRKDAFLKIRPQGEGIAITIGIVLRAALGWLNSGRIVGLSVTGNTGKEHCVGLGSAHPLTARPAARARNRCGPQARLPRHSVMPVAVDPDLGMSTPSSESSSASGRRMTTARSHPGGIAYRRWLLGIVPVARAEAVGGRPQTTHR